MTVIHRGLFLGRFQPFHNGHLSVVNEMLGSDDIDEVIIGIGSAQEANTIKNPFSAAERFEMIHNTIMQECTIDKPIHIIPIMDIHDNYKYISYLGTILPKFSVYYGSNDLMLRLCDNAGIETISTTYDEKLHRNGSWIRQNIQSNKLDWRDYVPEGTVRYILGNPKLYQWTEERSVYATDDIRY